MKLNTGIQLLSSRNVEKQISKKILLANTEDKKAQGKLGVGSPADPIYFKNSGRQPIFNPDIRYKNNYNYSPINDINIRNSLLLFAENNEIKKVIKAICNEIVITTLKSNKYPVYPTINKTNIEEDKQDLAKTIQEYIDKVFYPKLWQMYKFKGKGLWETIAEYLKTGKLAFEIVYDNLKRPKEIVNIIPIDTSTLQKYKENDNIWYVQKALYDNGQERILHENQLIILEWNEFDYGYISYVDQLRRPFNIMRSMQTSKVMWFAAKSQVRMHINLNLGDMSRVDAIQKLAEARDEMTNDFYFDDANGQVLFNGEPDTVGYHEFYTAETAGSGKPDIEEINTNGPDLTEVDSLQYWEKFFYKETEVPYDRIDPSSTETWSFVDVSAVRKTELNFSKFTLDIKDTISQLFIKPLIIQLTLQEVEIGVDLDLLDSINMEWVSFNEYDKLGELEVLDKKIQIATNLAGFGQLSDVNGNIKNMIPTTWIMDNYLDFTEEQKAAMETSRNKEQVWLGFDPEGSTDMMAQQMALADEEYIDEEDEFIDEDFL